MSKLTYTVNLESLAPEDCPEFIIQFDGIQYRAQVRRANSREFYAELLEPFKRGIYQEIPLFAIAFGSEPLVKKGKPTEKLFQILFFKIKKIHDDYMAFSEAKAAVTLNEEALSCIFYKTLEKYDNLCARKREYRKEIDFMESKYGKKIKDALHELELLDGAGVNEKDDCEGDLG